MKPLVVGLSGGIGTGKSLALRAFARLGALTVSLDEIARGLSRKAGPLHGRVVRAFGAGVLGRGGEIDRARLAERVFARPSERRRLENLSHPLILREMRRRLARARPPVSVVDVPLLFEAGLEPRFDLTLLVSSGNRAQLSRVMRRDALSAARARARIAAQWPMRVKEARADLVVRNDGSPEDLRSRIAQYYRAFELMSLGRVQAARNRR